LKTRCRSFELELEVPFAISRDTTSIREICVAEIEHDGITGYGEASPSSYYGDSVDKATDVIERSSTVLGDDPFAVELISERLQASFPESPSARAAIEMAVWDILGKMTGLPVFKLLGLAGKRPPRTSLTVGVSDVSLARGRIGFLSEFPILKAKVGFGDEEALLRLLKEETRAVLRVDANEGWSLDEAVEKIRTYGDRFSIEFFEQPLPKTDEEGYRRLREATNATIIVDESVVSKEDIVGWSGLVDGINIKLMKCGGLRHAVQMVSVARALGMKVMLGCMIESSLAITAAVHIAPLADYCDLDGNLLIRNDPFVGVKADRGVLTLPKAPGLGVMPVF
jgi:L-alanine-DL-glutamate epimerase-like enolase superfamily enzyme